MEEERAKVRVVRCPKCDKLLPELANFTVYRCGGCNATLQAKKRSPASEASSEKSDGETIKYFVNTEICSEKKAVVDCDSSLETYPKGERVEFKGEEKKHTSMTINDNVNVLKEPEFAKLIESPLENRTGIEREIGNTNFDDTVKEKIEEEQKTKMHDECSNGYHKVHQKQSPINRNRDWTETYGRANPYPDEGPSNHYQNPSKRKNIDNADEDRAELLKKLDELREQLRKSCEVAEKPNERSYASRTTIPSNPCARNNWFPDNSSYLNRASSRHSPFMNNAPNSMDISNLYPTFHSYGHPSIGRTQYPKPMSNCLYSQFDPDPLVSYHHDGFYHQPACSCLHCFNSHLPSINYPNPRAPYHVNNNHGFYQADGPLNYRQRHMFRQKDGRMCRPIGGAAPFVSCYNCFELLELPEDILLGGRKLQKLRCGSCSHLISLKYDGKRMIPSIPPTRTANATLENNNNLNSNMNRHLTNSYSGSFNSNEDEKLVLASYPPSSNEVREKEYNFNMSESDKMQGLSSSPSTHDYAESPDSMIYQRDVPGSAEGVARASSLPLREHFRDTLSNQVVDGPGNGSVSRRSEQEKIVPMNGNFKQNSVKDVLVDNYHDSDLCQDPWEASNDDDQPRVKNGKSGESFFAGFIKKSFRDISHGKCKVSINDRPISDRLVKKAEKLAGPIYPGNYWYDYRAGFWGVIGQACLGIIPPFIEEFNYPMPKNCSNGNTGVFVNGRELHEKDLSLLVGRGLPSIEDQSYIIEISGKVWDETTGEELEGLGKLAPTIEKVKHGFGMRVPRDFP